MAFRKEVFQAKVLQRLYPAPAPKAEVQDSPGDNLDSASRTAKLKQNKTAGSVGASSLPAKKIYTVLPPPEDYRPSSRDKELKTVSSSDRTAVDLSDSGNSDSAEGQDHVQRRRKRRRKRKADSAGAGGTGSTPLGNPTQEQAEKAEGRNGQTLEVPEGQEILSKSRKRKLKKKRQKEKLRSIGVVTKSRPLEFTYRRDGGNDEEVEEENVEENNKKVEEVVHFLRTMWDIYLSDQGTAPPAAMSGLCRLRTLLGQRDVEQLNTALQEFSHTSTLSTDETVLVHTLFNYWMTEVLPMQSQTAT
ncbi:glutamate-rich protein 1 isoform X2 [Astyanax mexicanus]|uniref:glutamate-rich protein 1 isoform X2 n=1 Tax=Astyanax mexicanus TaxID=7994 RepID=UPI0020CAF5E0|nr:glutamate-rich protein 1 isoform X2 [Astyanax mexicanus]